MGVKKLDSNVEEVRSVILNGILSETPLNFSASERATYQAGFELLVPELLMRFKDQASRNRMQRYAVVNDLVEII